MKRVIGITGSIASGKSTVSDYLISKGYKIVDCDKISHDIIKKNNLGYKKVIDYFGDYILDNNLNIDRKKLGSIVFKDKSKLNILNNILHPLILEETINQLNCNDLIFLDAPLLFETNFHKLCDYIIVVNIELENQIIRLINRDSINRELALNKINLQMKLEDKVKLATYVINNNFDKDYLFKQIDELLIEMEGMR